MRGSTLLTLLPLSVLAFGQQVVWEEDFENGCTQGCAATTFSGSNGYWSTMSTGTNGTCANIWFVSSQENGNPIGECGTGGTGNETLHIGNNAAGCTSPNSCNFCPTGDCGAAYDASCPTTTCSTCCSCQSSQTSTRAVSPVINLSGLANLTLRFKYIEGGVGATDNALLDYYNGTSWGQLADLPKTPVADCGAYGTWTAYTIALPATANNNANVRLGIRWVNNNDGTGSGPSIAVDDMEIVTSSYTPTCAGPIVNEVSHGLSGNKKYIELLVCGPPCGTVDLRRWKIDDNNGSLMNGFGTDQTTGGISAGHLRFSNAAQWAAVPVGSLIVIYNPNDVNPLLPPSDPSDTAPTNKVYVLPASNPLLEGCSTYPMPGGSANYGAVATFGAGNWNYLTMRPEGDAIQTRDPSGRYFHGISYGPDAQGMNNGGIDGLRISTLDHSGRVIYFNSGNERMPDSFTSALAAGNQTPGLPNNTANLEYINELECALLPVELLSFTARQEQGYVELSWATASELNTGSYVIDRSSDMEAFQPIGEVTAVGTSQQQNVYTWEDRAPLEGTAYYRLRIRDLDGSEAIGPYLAVVHVHPVFEVRPITGSCGVVVSTYDDATVWTLYDGVGHMLGQGGVTGGNALVPIPSGLSLLTLSRGEEQQVYRAVGVAGSACVARVR
ncbi:MAG TPA: hypothetical protein PLB89_09325 [Flavobacteriales bacterium]|nr:hypothetical protein [Flavobacteriales bacterium]